ncbi:tail fiber assembly protein [Pseudomonas rustica]|uniref:tail fiber assembly protein n=1 Tax=Pseudomonas rustica TaxID=2827099 RepID=UPI003CF78762
MFTYARVSDGVVHEIFETEGDINEMFAPGMEWILLTAGAEDVVDGWTYDATTGAFSAPVPSVPSPEQIFSSNTASRDYFLSAATKAIAPLQDAVDLGMDTEDESARLTAWKRYRVTVNRIDLTDPSPSWPAMPE